MLQYKPKDKGLGEITADIITKAARATDDVAMQDKLGLKAFLRGPADLRRSKFRETSLFLKKFSLSRVAFEKM